MLKKIAIVLTLMLVLGFVVSGSILAEEDFKAALLVSGNVDDEGWNQSAYEGLVLIEEMHGWDIAYTETVGQSEQYDIMRSYVNQGFDLIIGHGFQYEDALRRAAKQYPDVYFLQIGGFAENGDNLSSAVFSEGHSGYLPGILVAGLTETNKVGLIGALALPTITTEFAAMQNAIKNYNEDIEIMESYIGSMVDVGGARETAIAQIAQGVDIIVPIGDAAIIGVIEAALEEDVYVVGWSRDQSFMAPDLIVASLEQKIDLAIADFAEMIINDEFPGTNKLLGLDNGYIKLDHFQDFVPEDLVDEIKEAEEKIINNEIDLFGEMAK